VILWSLQAHYRDGIKYEEVCSMNVCQKTLKPGIFYMNMCLLKHRCILWAGLHCEFTRQQALHLQMDAHETTDQGFDLYLPWYLLVLLNFHPVVGQSCKNKERKFIMFRLKTFRLRRRVQHIDGR
jgi:hypothetical protein